MRIGARWLRFQQKYQYGLWVAYYRDVVSNSILNTTPVNGTKNHSCEIHALTCNRDWINLIWTLKSFYYYSKKSYALCIHEDGTLTKQQMEIMQRHFPDARIIDRCTSDLQLGIRLQNRPLSQAFRATNPLALKVFDFAEFLLADRMLLMDSDILFFAEPTALIHNIENTSYKFNCLNKDWGYGYSVDLDEVNAILPFQTHNLINSGLGLVHKKSIDYDHIEDYLKLPRIMSHSHRIEQTIIALYSSRYGAEILPEEYDVHLKHSNPASPCRHYTGPIRHRFYGEGIRRLMRSGIMSVGGETLCA